MGKTETKEWLKLYHAALLETDPEKLQALIPHAQNAIQDRVRELLT